MTNIKQTLDLEAGCNFRDLGGYLTQDGRQIKPGMLYRSGVMAYFSEQDKQQIAKLGIAVICDLRRSDERESEPTAWPENTEVQFLTWPDEPDLELKGRAWMDAHTGVEVYEQMIDFYRAMPQWLSNRLVGVFERLIAGDVPLLFHCSGGKDRTGLTAALILHTLGVTREMILQDYDLTNHAVDLEDFALKHKKAGMGLTTEDHPLLKTPKDMRQAMFKADTDYISAALDKIEADYGTVDAFLQHNFGINPEVKASLQERLLTAV